MKSMYLIWAFVALVGAVASHADAEEGMEAAERVCSELMGLTQQKKCRAVIADSLYFEKGAVSVCGDQFGATNVVDCLEAIRDRRYTATAVSACEDNFGPGHIIDCFKTSGRSMERDESRKNHRDCIKGARKRIKRAVHLIEKKAYRKANLVLEKVLESME